MTLAKIHLPDGGWERTKSGVVYGPIHLLVGEFGFPNSQWTDFVVVVLTWWCRALLQLFEGDEGTIEVRFMDGPYLVELGPRVGGKLRVTLVEVSPEANVLRRADVEFMPLAASILSAANQALGLCKANCWWSDDETNLAAAKSDLVQRIPTIVLH